MSEQISHLCKSKFYISVKNDVVIDEIVDKNVTALTISILEINLNDGNLELSVLSALLLVLLISD